jgi:hypothetical protein
MKADKAKGLLIASIVSAIACIFQIIGLVRYIGRIPDDWIGIVLFGITAVAFAIISLVLFIQWRQ